MTLDKSLTAKLFIRRIVLMHHQLVRWIERVQIPAVSKKKKTKETDRIVHPNNNCSWSQWMISLWDSYSI